MDFQVLYHTTTASITVLSQPSETAEDIPVIWLAAPEALLPSAQETKISPIPLAISVTLCSLIVIVLMVLYSRASKAMSTTSNSPASSTVATTHPPRNASPIPDPQHQPQTNPEPQPQTHNPSTPQTIAFDQLPPPRTPTPPHMLYHDYLHDNRHDSFQPNKDSPRLVSPSNYDTSLEEPPSDNLGPAIPWYSIRSSDDVNDSTRRKAVVSSNYSVSVDATPIGSRQNSMMREKGEGGWTRLRLGSRYDGDRTFIPSEAYLQFGEEKGNWV